jgi:hypothetical protein
VRPAFTLLVALATLPGSAWGQGRSYEAQAIAQRGDTIQGLLEELPSSSSERRIQIVSGLGALRAESAADLLVHDLALLHRGSTSPLRDPAAADHALASALASALAQIGRPGLDYFLETLATWPGYALDITWAFVSVHGEEGILVLRERARTEEDAERQRRLRAAAWFARLRKPEIEPGYVSPSDGQ